MKTSSLVPLHSHRVMSIHREGTFGRLRYALGGDRPSQTTRLALLARQLMAWLEKRNTARVVFHGCLHHLLKGDFLDSHLTALEAIRRTRSASTATE